MSIKNNELTQPCTHLPPIIGRLDQNTL